MTVEPLPILKDYTVFNPDFYKDAMRFMGLQCTEADAKRQIEAIDAANPLSQVQLETGELSLKERLNALVDRVEFIDHLEVVSKFAQQSKFVILKQEVRGIHWDIKALRLYLALTCIDIFCEVADHRSHFESVFQNLSGDTARLVSDNLTLQKANGTGCNLKELGLFFYNVRNFYTHAGRRFHIIERFPGQQERSFASGSKKHKEEQYLIVAQKVALVDILLRIAISAAKRRFEWTD